MKRNRTYLNEILADIRKTDIRSAKSWCAARGLEVIKEGRDLFVMEEDYLKVYNNPVSNSNSEISRSNEAISKYNSKGNHANYAKSLLLK